jgi:putative transposase
MSFQKSRPQKGGPMARIARFAVPGLPHHVTQRGNRGEQVFFGDGDYELYRDLLASQCRRQGVACWAYCVMPNHMHLILVPDTEQALGRALGETPTGGIRRSSTPGSG